MSDPVFTIPGLFEQLAKRHEEKARVEMAIVNDLRMISDLLKGIPPNGVPHLKTEQVATAAATPADTPADTPTLGDLARNSGAEVEPEKPAKRGRPAKAKEPEVGVPAAPVPTKEPGLTIGEMRVAIRSKLSAYVSAVADNSNYDKAAALLAEFGAKTAKEVVDEKIPSFFAKLIALIDGTPTPKASLTE